MSEPLPEQDRQVPHHPRARPRCDQRRLPGARSRSPTARSRSRSMREPAGRGHRPAAALSQGVPERSGAGRQAVPSAHPRHLRCGQRRERQLHRDGVRERPDARALLRRGQPAAGEQGGGDRLQVQPGAGFRPAPRRDPLRHQARQYPDQRTTPTSRSAISARRCTTTPSTRISRASARRPTCRPSRCRTRRSASTPTSTRWAW